jgi:AcrR family transcriptional regulator
MARRVDTEKKPALLERIVDYLLDRSISAVTFRTLSAALGIGTYTLVYHFGTRAELVREIITAIATRQRGFETVLASEPTLDGYFAGLQRTFDLSLEPRGRALQRLEFEAQMLEAIEPRDDAVTPIVRSELEKRLASALEALGLQPSDADLESAVLVDTFFGIQVGLVVNRDVARATESFDRAMRNHRDRIEQLQRA